MIKTNRNYILPFEQYSIPILLCICGSVVWESTLKLSMVLIQTVEIITPNLEHLLKTLVVLKRIRRPYTTRTKYKNDRPCRKAFIISDSFFIPSTKGLSHPALCIYNKFLQNRKAGKAVVLVNYESTWGLANKKNATCYFYAVRFETKQNKKQNHSLK